MKIFISLAILCLLFLCIFFCFKDKILNRFFYRNYVQDSAKTFNVDPLLVLSLIKEESNFSNRAVSKVGALGLMQLMPKTARGIAKDLGQNNFYPALLKEPSTNIKYGTYYLKSLMHRYNNNLVLALCAYNAGSRIVDGWISTRTLLNIKDIPYASTRIFVAKVLRNYKVLGRIRKVIFE